MERRTSATTIASSSCPAIGMKLGTTSSVPAPADEHQADEQRRVDDQRHAQSEQ
jgi:hypothetical protein